MAPLERTDLALAAPDQRGQILPLPLREPDHVALLRHAASSWRHKCRQLEESARSPSTYCFGVAETLGRRGLRGFVTRGLPAQPDAAAGATDRRRPGWLLRRQPQAGSCGRPWPGLREALGRRSAATVFRSPRRPAAGRSASETPAPVRRPIRLLRPARQGSGCRSISSNSSARRLAARSASATAGALRVGRGAVFDPPHVQGGGDGSTGHGAEPTTERGGVQPRVLDAPWKRHKLVLSKDLRRACRPASWRPLQNEHGAAE